MTTDRGERVRRDVPQRAGPIRSAAAFVRPPYIPERSAPPQGAAHSNHDSVERAVGNAYRVLDEQLRRGEEAARSYRDIFDRGGSMTEDLTRLPRNMVRLWSEVIGLWLDVLGPLAPQSLRSALRGYSLEQPWPALNPPQVEPPSAALPAASFTRVTLDVSTTKPVEVSVDLTGEVEPSEVVVQDLGAFEGGGKPPIGGARLSLGHDRRLVLRLAIAPDQPPGTYLGMILDRVTAEQRGTVRVLIRA